MTFATRVALRVFSFSRLDNSLRVHYCSRCIQSHEIREANVAVAKKTVKKAAKKPAKKAAKKPAKKVAKKPAARKK